MGSSVSGQDDLNRALWLATRAGKQILYLPRVKYIIISNPVVYIMALNT